MRPPELGRVREIETQPMGGRVPGTRCQQADGWGVVERSRSRFRRDPRDPSRRGLWRFARPARWRRGAAGPDEHRRHCARGEGRVWRHRCGASGAPGGWPVQRFSPQSSLRHVCPTIVIIGHTEYAQKRGKLKKPYCTDRPYSRKSTSWSNRPAAPLARPNMPPTGQPTVATRSIPPPASTARLRRFAPSRRAGR